jgi:HAD superfamily hydrolase (TIGR01509 family)
MEIKIPFFRNLILDLGDVCFSYNAKAITAISPKKLKSIFDCPAWHEQECGRLSREETFARVSEKFGTTPEILNEALKQAVESLKIKERMIETVRQLKKDVPDLQVYAMSNISATDFESTKALIDSWGIFDGFFPSAHAGCRKPEFAFFHHVLDTTDMVPESAVFIDDKFENVIVGQSLGFNAIHFDNEDNVIRRLHQLFDDPVRRGEAFLQTNAGRMFCETNTGMEVFDNFSQLLLLHVTGNQYASPPPFHPSNTPSSLVSLQAHERTWNFFQGAPLLTTETFPDDLDDTALALLLPTPYSPCRSTIASVLDEMQSHITPDGLLLTYFDAERPRFDPFVGANVLRLFYANRRGHQLAGTLGYMHKLLFTRGYKFGTRYYHLPDWLFYYLAELVSAHSDPELEGLRLLLKRRLQEGIGRDTDVMACALRCMACRALGMDNERDLATLVSTQEVDGGWPMGWLNRYGSSGIKVGSRGVVTAMAVRCIREHGDLQEVLMRI